MGHTRLLHTTDQTNRRSNFLRQGKVARLLASPSLHLQFLAHHDVFARLANLAYKLRSPDQSSSHNRLLLVTRHSVDQSQLLLMQHQQTVWFPRHQSLQSFVPVPSITSQLWLAQTEVSQPIPAMYRKLHPRLEYWQTALTESPGSNTELPVG